MPRLTINGVDHEVPYGARLSTVLGEHGETEQPCGGLGLCGKCRVTAVGALSDPTDEELGLLSPDELACHTRLSCRTRILGDAQVTVAQEQASEIRTDGVERSFSPKPLFHQYGAAVDIGTTTLAARLYGAEGLLAQASAPNPQIRFGADVMTRMGRALDGEGDALTACIRAAVSALLTEMTRTIGLETERLDAVVVTGNTVMLYLLTGRDTEPLSHAPFEADYLFDCILSAAVLDLPCPNAAVYLPPCISAFVGADVVTALLASGICLSDETALMVDIGTNGEMALWHEGALLCCSTAAGPAFEGAGLSMGMAGRAGAIDHVAVRQGVLEAHVLGDVPPVGICGSGVIDAVAALLATEQMDETGALDEDIAMIASPVSLSQKDIRMLQLAKSAVRSGMDTLVEQGTLPNTAVASLAIAGGFGSYLDVRSAAAIGLIPPQLTQTARILGNAALSGGAMLLRNTEFTQEIRDLARCAKVLDLTKNPVFSHYYVENMMF